MKWLALVLAVLVVPVTALAAGNEIRCVELASNCIASEPLNTATYTGGPYDWNPADTTGSDKQATFEGATGTVINDGDGFVYVAQTSPNEMFTALPNISGSITRILRSKTTAEGNANGGGNFIGHQGFTAKHIAFRYYLYYSPTWQISDGTDGSDSSTCSNSSKFMEIGHNPTPLITGSGNGNWHIYGWTGFNNTLVAGGGPACCGRGPTDQTATFNTYNSADVQGKWFRFEVHVVNGRTSDPAPMTVKIYKKNVTDNTAEVTIVDTTMPTTQPNVPPDENWTSTMATTLHPVSANVDGLWSNTFRRDTCSGYFGYTHFIWASWTTDAGQRIGAATEIEGGAVDSPAGAPATPLNLHITKLMKGQ